MHRFFTDQIHGGTAQITGADVYHATKVLRLKPGDPVSLCDGQGHDYDGLITGVSESTVTCTVGKPILSKAEPKCRITLFQCLPKTGKMELIVQKCTELGVHALVPVLSRRCVAQPANNYEIKRQRYQRVAEEAAKQSRRGAIPRFESLTRLTDIDPGAFDLFLLAYEEEQAVTLKSIIKKNKSAATVGILIGPEGGFDPEEAELLTAKNAIAVSLGARILRTETAGMAMLAQILYEVEK